LTYHQVSNWINTTGTISGARTYASGAHEFTHCFNGVHVIRSLGLCVCFVDRCLSFFFWTLRCLFFFDLGFRLPFCIFKLFLPVWQYKINRIFMYIHCLWI